MIAPIISRNKPQDSVLPKQFTVAIRQRSLEPEEISNSDDFFEMKSSRTSPTTHIDWLTIPARTPDFGGLWEAADKSMKRHR